jgi:hypothetical protein
MTSATPRTCARLVLLFAACSAPPASSPPPASAAPAPAAPADDGAGFADPKLGSEPSGPAPSPAPPADPELDAKIKQRFGERCRHERSCGELLGIDCQSAVDGPYYYTQRDLTVVSTCGGACRLGCTDCPPKAWTCKTY